ncbi:MAG TPA: hypothetical protein VGH51_11640 [Candidatus Angelobacter sp.]
MDAGLDSVQAIRAKKNWSGKLIAQLYGKTAITAPYFFVDRTSERTGIVWHRRRGIMSRREGIVKKKNARIVLPSLPEIEIVRRPPAL